MKELEVLYFKNGNDFREWLDKNFESSPGIWMLYYKKHVNIECITYDVALDEALCYGWVDSLIKKIDDDKYARKFTPRKDITKWSEVNKHKVFKLHEKGKMVQAGIEKAMIVLNAGKIDQGPEKQVGNTKKQFDIPEFVIAEFAKHEPALINFNKLAPSHKRNYILWITNAKREETISKRISEAIQLLKENKELGLK